LDSGKDYSSTHELRLGKNGMTENWTYTKADRFRGLG